MPQLLPAIALEISAFMLMLGELGFLGVLIGGALHRDIYPDAAGVSEDAGDPGVDCAAVRRATGAIPVAVAFAGTRPRISLCYTWLQSTG